MSSTTIEFWQRALELFEATLLLAPRNHLAFVDRAADGDEPLRRAVERLLLRDRDETSFLEARGTGQYFPKPITRGDKVHGQRTGRYRLLRRIGTGGMSSVFLAASIQDRCNPRRHVAIKLARSDSHGQISSYSLHREQQILTRLEHPNIARLLDEGATPEGRPFLVLEFAEGPTITEYCDAARLGVAARIQVFRQVCQAVEHVHRRRVVHRDLKPGNILMTESKTPKLLDFGIAKQLDPQNDLDAANLTLIRSRYLTPGYASPEQIAGEPASIASDLYSLGVVFHQLLTGHRPDELETKATIESGANAILDRCLREDPEERYSSAAELFRALSRYLRQSPSPDFWHDLQIP